MWLWNGEEFTEDMIEEYVGFVYLITNLDNGIKYIGKKNFTRSKTYQKNKKVRRTRVASDWTLYTGSNKQLNEAVSDTGAVLHKEILYLCSTKGWMSYFETLEILQRNAIQSEEYYNNWVSCKIQRTHLSKGENNEFTRTQNLV